jgi:hypothetical protein
MTDSMQDEHRRFTRVPFPATALLRSRGRAWNCVVLDLSLKGALLQRLADWPAASGEAVDLEIKIADDVVIQMQGIVAHIEADHAGISCQHIDLDSAAHLRRLVELNLGDEARLHRELAAMIVQVRH